MSAFFGTIGQQGCDMGRRRKLGDPKSRDLDLLTLKLRWKMIIKLSTDFCSLSPLLVFLSVPFFTSPRPAFDGSKLLAGR